jgi:hypothetical protein
MGNVDSKQGRKDIESTVASDVVTKRSKESLYSNFPSYDGNDDVEDKLILDNREATDRIAGRNGSTGSNNTRDDDLVVSDNHENSVKKVSDDQIHVNMAMADLMAYLQVVANNSNNLPLTRRDDPELDRTVSTLSSEEYARKSAAFIPADVRVIGGTFTRYGRVWDLPTSEVSFSFLPTTGVRFLFSFDLQNSFVLILLYLRNTMHVMVHKSLVGLMEERVATLFLRCYTTLPMNLTELHNTKPMQSLCSRMTMKTKSRLQWASLFAQCIPSTMLL